MELLLSLLEWISQHPQVSGMLFVGLTAVMLAVGVPGGNVLLLTSGLLFGWLQGAFLAVFGLALAALLTHLLIRTAFGSWLEQRAERSGWLNDERLINSNALLLILPRLVPVIPFFALNVLYALAGVPRWTYMWTTVLGVIPTSLIMSRVGSQFSHLEDLENVRLVPLLMSPDVLLPLALLALLTFSGWWWLRRPQAS